ncbi:MAG: hypothetical protein HYT37_04575 [Candidatus Sungbacteria bacterium]|nr:hypothetical protein [Candidatus Sungbacteria bacterium]
MILIIGYATQSFTYPLTKSGQSCSFSLARGECLFNKAIMDGDPRICALLPEDFAKNYYVRDRCYFEIALKKKDISICSLISFETYPPEFNKKICYFKIQSGL